MRRGQRSTRFTLRVERRPGRSAAGHRAHAGPNSPIMAARGPGGAQSAGARTSLSAGRASIIMPVRVCPTVQCRCRCYGRQKVTTHRVKRRPGRSAAGEPGIGRTPVQTVLSMAACPQEGRRAPQGGPAQSAGARTFLSAGRASIIMPVRVCPTVQCRCRCYGRQNVTTRHERRPGRSVAGHRAHAGPNGPVMAACPQEERRAPQGGPRAERWGQGEGHREGPNRPLARAFIIYT